MAEQELLVESMFTKDKLMTEKSFALVDNNETVVNVAVIDDEAPVEFFEHITSINNAVKYYDCTVYGWTGVGGFFNGEKLVMPKLYPSWIRGEKDWEPPVPKPETEDKSFIWNEETLNWIEI